MSLTPSAAVAPASNRIQSLDIIRGIALLGLLIISIWEFGGFTNAEQNYLRTGSHQGNYKLMAIISMLFEGKMRALVALVFGAGIVLFMQKKNYLSAIGAPDAFIRKQMWLMFFGLFTAFILLWPGDILFQFGVVGIFLFAFWRVKPKGLVAAAIICTLIYCGKQYWNYTDDKKTYKKYTAVIAIEKKFKADSLARATKDSLDRKKDTVLLKDVLLNNKRLDSIAKKNDTLTNKQADEKGAWEGTVKSFKYDSAQAKKDRKSMTGSWGKTWTYLKQRSQMKESGWLYRIGLWDIGSMMFFGMALLGIGFFNNKFSPGKYFSIGIIAVTIGLFLAWYRIHVNVIRVTDYEKFIQTHGTPYNLFFPIERAVLAVGYASMIMWMVRMKAFYWFSKAAEAVGKMALTNYFIQVIICTFFFYGYGFGYYGKLHQWQLYFMVAEIALVQIVFSVLWLRHYSMGPMEWLLRSLMYRKKLSMKKEIQVATD